VKQDQQLCERETTLPQQLYRRIFSLTPSNKSQLEVLMGDKREFSATSQVGDFGEALRAAAGTELSSSFFAWSLESVTGTVGGFVNAHDVTVTISAGGPSIHSVVGPQQPPVLSS
jgi:hypothetical protein